MYKYYDKLPNALDNFFLPVGTVLNNVFLMTMYQPISNIICRLSHFNIKQFCSGFRFRQLHIFPVYPNKCLSFQKVSFWHLNVTYEGCKQCINLCEISSFIVFFLFQFFVKVFSFLSKKIVAHTMQDLLTVFAFSVHSCRTKSDLISFKIHATNNRRSLSSAIK